MFEWDEDKNRSNIRKHGVGFQTAIRIFENAVLSWADERAAYGEMRHHTIGQIEGVVFLAVIHTDRAGKIRISPPGRRTAAKGNVMTKKYEKELSLEELLALPDEKIDYSDIPELDENFWTNAKLVEPEGTQQITLRIKKSVIEAYKSTGKGYQTRMNAVLESYARTLRKR
ncbi:conserved hypothetical protein [Agrobacterium fabrum str. J-07]|nr:conserved hypothetical protein [Agrobacterium fabrum str. J-07]